MKNLGQLMKQAQEMQSRMAEMQERLKDSEVVGQAGGGMVQITMNGKHEVRAVKIDPSLIDPAEAEVLEDLIAAAVNDARGKIETFMQEEMQNLTGGMNLPPGFKLPFKAAKLPPDGSFGDRPADPATRAPARTGTTFGTSGRPPFAAEA